MQNLAVATYTVLRFLKITKVLPSLSIKHNGIFMYKDIIFRIRGPGLFNAILKLDLQQFGDNSIIPNQPRLLLPSV